MDIRNGAEIGQNPRWSLFIRGRYAKYIGNNEKKQRFEADPVFRAKVIAEGEKHLRERTPDMPTGRFDVIYADPPWRYDFDVESRATENHYPTLLLRQICNLRDTHHVRIQDKFEIDAILFLWATAPKLNEALRVIDAWGFTYKTNMAWVKDKMGLGWYCRNQHELLLIAERGNMPLPEASTRPVSVKTFPRGTHSTKPKEYYELIELMYPNQHYLEVFGIGEPHNERWTVFGNHIYKE